MGGRQNLPVIEVRSRARVIWGNKVRMCRTFTTWLLSTQKGHSVQSGGLGKLLDSVSMHGGLLSLTASTSHQSRVNSVLCPFWLLLCYNCGTQIIKGPKSSGSCCFPLKVLFQGLEVAPSVANHLDSKERNTSQGILGALAQP